MKPTALFNHANRFRRADSGVAAVEFALISTILMLLFLALIDYAIAVFHKMELTSAVRSGAQYAVVDDTTGADTTIATTVANSTNLDLAGGITVTKMYGCSDTPDNALVDTAPDCGTARQTVYKEITATYTHTWIFMPDWMQAASNVTMTATSVVRIE